MEEKIGFDFYKKNLELFTEKLKLIDVPKILAVALFGSVARNEAKYNSDIDLIIIFDGERADGEKLREVIRQITKTIPDEHFCSRLWPILLSKKRIWEDGRILLDVLDHGIILYDTGALQERFEALRKKLQELGAKKVVLPDGKWYWDLKPDWKPGDIVEI